MKLTAAAVVEGLLGFAYTELGGRYFGHAITRLSNSSRLYGFLTAPPGIQSLFKGLSRASQSVFKGLSRAY
jgi:hypothetical protein